MPLTAITYGTFDMFHIGHLRLLERIRGMSDRLIVGVSTDEFNALKGKKAMIAYEERRDIVAALRCVDLVIPEHTWGQKAADIEQHGVGLFAMGGDWAGRFDELKTLCDVAYLERTQGVSSTELRTSLKRVLEKEQDLADMFELLKSVRNGME